MAVTFDLLLIAIVAPGIVYLYGRKHRRWSRSHRKTGLPTENRSTSL